MQQCDIPVMVPTIVNKFSIDSVPLPYTSLLTRQLHGLSPFKHHKYPAKEALDYYFCCRGIKLFKVLTFILCYFTELFFYVILQNFFPMLFYRTFFLCYFIGLFITCSFSTDINFITMYIQVFSCVNMQTLLNQAR